jgi:hypothetical protein
VKTAVRKFWCYRLNLNLCGQEELMETQRQCRCAEGWDTLTYAKRLETKGQQQSQSAPPDSIRKTQTGALHWGHDRQFLLHSAECRCPTPATWQAEGIFGLGWPDWSCYFRGLHWLQVDGLLLCHEPYVNVNNLGCDPLSTSEPWFSATVFPNSTLGPHK